LRGIFDLDGRREKINKLEKLTSESTFWDDNRHAQKVLKEISTHKKWIEKVENISMELSDFGELLDLTDGDENSSEAQEIRESLGKIFVEFELLETATLLSGRNDASNAIMTIHPGAGGTESQDWAEMLFRMYNRWCETRGFSVKLLDYLAGDEAGLKSATLEIEGEFAYGNLRSESGVHRLVRISPFDANSRRHTSFVSVYIFPEVDDEKIEWGSQIRSYVFHPYNMVKDHRTNKETSNIQAVMDGGIDIFINAFLADPELAEN